MNIMKPLRCLAAAFCIASAPAQAAEPITIAVAGPFTGNAAASGDDMKRGALAAVSVINARDGIDGRPLRLRFEDDACSNRDAVSVANRIIASGVHMLFGHFCSDATLVAMNAYRESPLAQLTISQDDRITSPAFRQPFVNRINVGNSQLAAIMARAALDGAQRTAILYDRSIYGHGIRDGALRVLREHNVEPLHYEFNADERDFSAMATKLRAERIDTAILIGSASQIGIVIRQLRENGYKGRFFTPGTGTLPTVGATAFCAVEGTTAAGVAVARDIYERSPEIQAAFTAQDAQPRDTVLISYAAIEALAEARRRARTDDPAAIGQALSNGTFDTLLGPLSWDIHGNLRQIRVALYGWRCENGIPVLGSPTIVSGPR